MTWTIAYGFRYKNKLYIIIIDCHSLEECPLASKEYSINQYDELLKKYSFDELCSKIENIDSQPDKKISVSQCIGFEDIFLGINHKYYYKNIFYSCLSEEDFTVENLLSKDKNMEFLHKYEKYISFSGITCISLVDLDIKSNVFVEGNDYNVFMHYCLQYNSHK